jgi:DNA-binding transcriptional ArsR family regulator
MKATGLKQAHVSRSLACLLQCGFVDVSKKGRNRVYRLNGSTAPLLSAADRHMKFYRERAKACEQLK